MAEEQVKEVVQEVVQEVNTDFVQLVKDSASFTGIGSFTRITLGKHVTDQGLVDLNAEYNPQGYEVFSSTKDVLLLKQ